MGRPGSGCQPAKSRRSEWGPKALFAIPLNCRYQVFNGSGQERVRLSCTNDAPMTMNLYHNEKFIFENDFAFAERIGAPNLFEGEGELVPVERKDNAGQINIWETNFCSRPDEF